MQLFNSWYAIAFSSEVEQNKPTSAVIHGQRLALWRTSNGDVIATQDRCPHKGASLSSGTVDCDRLICGYHGWRFKADGHCDLIPAQTSTGSLPRRAQLHQLPCQESQGFVWVWWSKEGLTLPGDAEPSPLPDVGPLPTAGDRGWRVLEGQVDWKAHYLRVLEAFSDLTHAPFVHSGSFGAMAPDQLLPEEHWSTEDSVYERVLAPRDKKYRADQGRGLRSWLTLIPALSVKKVMMEVFNIFNCGWPIFLWCVLYLVIFRVHCSLHMFPSLRDSPAIYGGTIALFLKPL